MEFRVLGPFEVRRNGVSIDLRGSKRRAVLALLVLHANEVVRTERLIEDVWGHARLTDAPAALRNHVSRLRKSLGDDVLITKPWGYVLRVEKEQVDLTRFERLVAESRPLPARERAKKLDEALGLWRGPALADLSTEPALQLEINRLEELRLATLEQRIDADLELGRHEDVVGELEVLIAEEPLREHLRGQLILALYRSGRQAEALETYRETRRVLVNELGLEPSPELRELERAILRQDPSLEPALAARMSDDERPPRWRWPRSPLIGVGAALLVLGAGIAVAAGSHDDPVSGPDAGVAVVSPGASSNATGGTTAPKSIAERTSHASGHTASAPSRPRPSKASRSTPPTHPARRPAVASHPRKTKDHIRAAITHPATTARPGTPKVYWLADSFETPSVDYSMWHIASHGSGVDSAERNGQLEFSIAPDATGETVYGVDEHYGTNCRLMGDFDARVGFKVLVWPPGNGTYITFGAYFPSGAGFWNIARQGQPANGGAEAYSAATGSSNLVVPTADTSGSMRIRRVAGLITEYYRHGNAWVKMGSHASTRPVQLLLGLYSNGDQFGGVATTAAFDDFVATADDVDCPGVPRPPLKPR